MRWTRIVSLVAAVAFAAGCADSLESDSSANEDDSETIYEYVPQSKADNYRTNRGREYLLTGTDTVTLTGEATELEGEARQERAKELISGKFKALSYFLYAYLAAKSHDDENSDYGDFRTTIRQKTFEALSAEQLDEDPNTYRFTFEAEAAGPEDLVDDLPIDREQTFDLTLPKLSNDELDSGSYSSTYDDFTPADYEDDELTSIELGIEAQDDEPNAYPEYQSMFEDGLVDIAIHVGGDYNDDRYDMETARELFETLQTDLGLESPVMDFERLESDSGPFVGTLDANGESIDIEVTLIHPNMQKEEGVGYEGLLELYRESAASDDIVIYDGHAGYSSGYSGVVVHYDPRHAIPADDFDELDLPEKDQLFVFNGCKTYTSYADAMYAHPAKSSENLDIITTVNFSWLSEMTDVTTDFVGHLVDTSSGTHAPRTYDDVLADLNSGRNWNVIYGVHGIADNPHSSPYAEPDSLCQSCESSSDCPGIDNRCLRLQDDRKSCATACTADSGCPDGYTCEAVARPGSNTISDTQCVPTGGQCSQ